MIDCLRRIPIKGFIESSFLDWPGKICAVVFLPLCNFKCRYCHNADLVVQPDIYKDFDFQAILERLATMKGWIDGVCVSGGEPTLHAFLPEMLRAIKQAGFLTKLDTNGTHPEVLHALIEEQLVDYVAMDIKGALDEASYSSVTQAPHWMEAVKSSIKILLTKKVDYEFRFTVVPGLHGTEDVYKVAQELNGAARLRIQNFNPSENMLDASLRTTRPYPQTDIDSLQQRINQIIAT